MPVAALEIPLINPLRFVPVDGEITVDPRNNFVTFDADWFTNYIRDWQTKTTYFQKWQFNDRIAHYLYANTLDGFTIQLLDCRGRVWNTWSSTLISAPQVQIEAGQMGYAYLAKFRFSDVASLPEGIYWLMLTVGYDLDNNGTVDFYRHNLSEPISIATKHYGTSHLDYYNTYNAQDIYFEQGRVRFSKRGMAEVVDYAPASTDTQSEDGADNAYMLASQPYRVAKWALTERIPEWELDKYNRAWGCNRVTWENLGFSKEIGGKFEVNRLARLPKVTATLPIREANNRQGAIQIVAPSFYIYTGGSYPYFVKNVSITDTSANVITFGQRAIIHNATEQTAFLAALNAEAASNYLSGNFSYSTSTFAVTWSNGAGDTFISGAATVVTQFYSYQISGNNVAYPIHFRNLDVAIEYGDGIVQYVTQAGFYATANHTYATSGTYTLRIFGTYTLLTFDDGYLTNPGGMLPVGLQIFSIANSFTITTLNAAIFGACAASITQISVYACSNLATVTGFTYPALNLSVINTAIFTNNKLNSTQASGIVVAIQSFITANNGPLNGLLNTSGQTPAAPMTFGGSFSKFILATTFGWAVYTD